MKIIKNIAIIIIVQQQDTDAVSFKYLLINNIKKSKRVKFQYNYLSIQNKVYLQAHV